MLEAIVLAGGLGMRLRQVVPDLPKPMAPVGERPFLEILLKELALKGFSRVVLSLGFMADKIVSHFGKNFAGIELEYVVEAQPLGTGGAVRLALTRCTQDHVFVLNGDTFLSLDTEAINKQWIKRRNPIVVACMVSDTARYGRLLVHEGKVSGFSEKSISGNGLINAGCYVFSRSELDRFELNSPFSLERDFLQSAVKCGSVDVFVASGRFIDIGVPEDYLRAQHELS